MKPSWKIVVGLMIASIAIHLVPFFIYGPHALGYDTGFYRRYLIQPFDSFPNTSVPGFNENALVPRLFLDTLRITGLGPDSILYGSYIFLFTLQAVALFFLVRLRFNDNIGFLAAVFLIASPIQYTAYWFMFFKNALALPFMLAEFVLLEKGSRLAIPLGILFAFSHHTTSIIFLLTLGIFAALNREKRNTALPTLVGTFLAFLYLHYASFQEYLNYPVAVFMRHEEYLILSLPLLILALFGIKEFVLEKPHSVTAAFSIVAIAFPLFSLPFYERIFIFTDIIIVIAAALGFKNLFDNIQKYHYITGSFSTREVYPEPGRRARSKNIFRACRENTFGIIKLISTLLMIILPLWIFLNLYGRMQNLRPLVSAQEIEELENISSSVSPDAAILTSTPYAPWVWGWSQNKVIAPGLLQDTHTAQEWISFNNGTSEEKINFLRNFPRPLYFFLKPEEKEKFLENFKECSEAKTPYLFQYACD